MTTTAPPPRAARPTLRLVALLAALVVAAGALWFTRTRPDNPTSLVLIVVDTLRSDHLPSYGYRRDTAPFLTRLAEDGIQVQGYSASPWTKASMVTLLSGLHPQRHQTFGFEDALPEEVPYLPALLAERGYRTVGFNSNGTLASFLGLARGYQKYLEPPPERTAKPDAKEVTDAVLSLARNLASGGDEPFLLYAHYLDPHDPYEPPRAFGSDLSPAEFVQPQDVVEGRLSLTGSVLEKFRDQYDGEIRQMDEEISRLFDGLDALGLLDDDTILVVTSDHGEEFGDHGRIGHGKTVHAESVQVPLIFWRRSDMARYVSDDAFHQVDFLPTILEALQLSSDPELGALMADLDGRSRWRDLQNQALGPASDFHFHLDLYPAGELGLLDGRHKFIHRRGTPSNLLFDVEVDPGERTNLVSAGKKRGEFLARVIAHHNTHSATAHERVITEEGDSARAALEALGYVEPENASLSSRRMPTTLEVFDTRVLGLFGDEDPTAWQTRLDLPANSPQLLGSWKPVDTAAEHRLRGPWSGAFATVVLPIEGDGSQSVVVTGLVSGATTRQCRITLSGGESAAAKTEPRVHSLEEGRFDLRIPVPAELSVGPVLYVDLEVRPLAGETAAGMAGLQIESVGWAP